MKGAHVTSTKPLMMSPYCGLFPSDIQPTMASENMKMAAAAVVSKVQSLQCEEKGARH